MNINIIKWSIFEKTSFIFYVMILLIFNFPIFSYANGAKLYSPPLEQSGIYFDDKSNISLLEEYVTFTQVNENSRDPQFEVSVKYTLKNLTELEKDIKMFFVIPPATKYKVLLEEVDITHLCSYNDSSLPKNWIPKNSKEIIDPISKKGLTAYYVNKNETADSKEYKDKINGLEIPISIDENGISNLKIEYTCSGGFNSGGEVKNTVCGYIYYLTPAKLWNGNADVTLRVDFKENKNYAFYSNIPMKKISYSSYETNLTEIPDTEWLFSYTDKAGLIFGTNSPRIHTKITSLISLLIFGFSVTLNKRYKKSWILPIGYLVSVVFVFLFLGKITDGYIGDALIYLILFVLLLFVIPTVFIIRKLKKNKIITYIS